MAKATQLLSVLARLNPAIYDFIFPHGPAVAHAFASRISEVALNPQPLPPEPPPERLQRVSALVAHNIAFAAIAAEALPWASKLTTISTTNYIIIEGVKVAILYGGELCVLNETTVTVTGKAGGSINNETETATFSKATLEATKTELKALNQKIEWNGVFPTEAFEWHREQALTVS